MKKDKEDSSTKTTKKSDFKHEKRHCHICGASEKDVNLTIQTGYDTYICDRCANIIYSQMEALYKYTQELMELTSDSLNDPDIMNVPTPHEIKDFLDDYVIGQDEAKIKIAVAVYNHYKRLLQEKNDTDIEKSNMLILGSSGSGKCVTGDTKVTIRNKKTGEVENISIEDFITKYTAEA